MNQMRVALAFRRWDVDAFMHEVEEEQFTEWTDFFQLEPNGWPALQIATGRIAYMVHQTQTKKRLKERNYAPKTAAASVRSDRMEMARFEAESIRSEVRQQLRKPGK